MKTLILFLLTALFLTGCTAVKFQNPQPASAPAIAEFPAKIIGVYVSEESDTLQITATSFRYTAGKEVTVEAELSPSKAVLKRINQTYILNLKDDLSWDVFPLKISKNQLIAYIAYLDADSVKLLKTLKEISSLKEITTDDGKFDHYLIDPSDKEFKKLLRKKLFSEKITYTRLR